MDSKVFELVDKHVPPKRPKDFGMTAGEYARAKGISPHYARRILNDLLDAGIIEKAVMLSGKSVCDVFFEPKKKKK